MGRYDPELITKGFNINKCRCGGNPQPYKVVNTSNDKTVAFLLQCIEDGCNRRTEDKLTLEDAIKDWNDGKVFYKSNN